jgi:DNA polymerase III sliding clamp (beta) subunit (PCNA family)
MKILKSSGTVRSNCKANSSSLVKTSEDEAEEFIDIDYDADEVVLGLNASYVEEALGAIRNEKVLFSFSDGQSGVKIESVDHDEGISVITLFSFGC